MEKNNELNHRELQKVAGGQAGNSDLNDQIDQVDSKLKDLPGNNESYGKQVLDSQAYWAKVQSGSNPGK